MPELSTGGAAPPKGKAKGLGLKKKIGPLPLWAWLGVGAGLALIVYLRYRDTSGGGGYGVETVTGADGVSNATPMDQAGAGQPSQNAAPGFMLDQAALDQITAATAAGASRYDIQDELLDRFARMEESQVTPYEPGFYEPAITPAEAVVDATLASPGQAIRPKATPVSKILSVTRTKTGGKITTYQGGRKIQQEPGRTPYVIARGKGAPSGVKPAPKPKPKQKQKQKVPVRVAPKPQPRRPAPRPKPKPPVAKKIKAQPKPKPKKAR